MPVSRSLSASLIFAVALIGLVHSAIGRKIGHQNKHRQLRPTNLTSKPLLAQLRRVYST